MIIEQAELEKMQGCSPNQKKNRLKMFPKVLALGKKARNALKKPPCIKIPQISAKLQNYSQNVKLVK